MRSGICLLCALWMAGAGLCVEPAKSWEVLTTTKGKAYERATLTAVEADGIKIVHAAGVARVPYEELPEALQAELGFDPAKAAQARAARSKAEQAGRKKLAEENRRALDKINGVKDPKAEAWQNRTLKVHQVLGGGVAICYQHHQGGVPGAVARGIGSLTGNAPVSSSSWTDYETALYVEGIKGEVAEGDVLTAWVRRDGVKEINGRALQRWVSKQE